MKRIYEKKMCTGSLSVKNSLTLQRSVFECKHFQGQVIFSKPNSDL